MTVLLVVTLVLLGGTTWLALQQQVAGSPSLNRRLTGAGLLLCLAAGLAFVVGGFVTLS